MRTVNLTKSQVREIFSRLKRGDKQSSIAADYGLTQGWVSKLKRKGIDDITLRRRRTNARL